MKRILFVMLHPGFIRYYESALHALVAAGHHVHLAFEVTRDKLGEDVTAARLVAGSDRMTCGTTPARTESVRAFLARGDRSATRSGERRVPASRHETRTEAWESLATTVRLAQDYLRFFEPAFAGAHKLRARAEKRLPRIHARVVRLVARGGPLARRSAGAVLHGIERIIPVNPAIASFVREQNPDLLLVTPLIELGSQQVDYVKCAGRQGVPSALCVASWDNLTSKGLIRVIPDRVIVWNEAQKAEAVALHGVAPDNVVVTGAQLFDQWFDARPSRTRGEFCRMAGLDPARPFVLYVGSSIFIAPDEVPFAERWLSRLRASRDAAVSGAGVLIRPHPANSRQWRALDLDALANVALWPPIGTDPNSPGFRRDYVDSLYYCAAVVGINTSAQLEAGIVGRPVLTVRASEFAHAQAGTLHFQHLVNPGRGLVQMADSLDEHVDQLAAILAGTRPELDAGARAFVQSFLRPFGLDVPVAPIFAGAIDTILRTPRPAPRPEGPGARAARPLMYIAARMARSLAEDRPLWVYLLRPVVFVGVWSSAAVVGTIDGTRRVTRTAVKRVRRGVHRTWYESSERLRKRWRRAQKPIGRAARTAGVAAKRVLRRT